MFDVSESYGDVCIVKDGYLYTFSCSSALWDWGNVRIAGAPIAGDAFKLRENYTFWNGSDWVADSSAATPIMDAPDGGIGSIEWNDYLGCWLYTYVRVFDNEIAMRVADELTGPWAPPTHIFTALMGTSGFVFPYFARAHKILEEEDGRIQYVTYSVQNLDTGTGSRLPFTKVRFGDFPTSPPLGEWQRIIARHSDKALGTTPTLTGIAQWPQVDDAYAQQWMLEDYRNNWVRIKNRLSGRNLEVVPVFGEVPNGQPVRESAPNTGDWQIWSLVDRGNGYFALRNRATGKVLEIAGGSMDDGVPAQVWDDLKGANQQWYIGNPFPTANSWFFY